MPHFSHRLALLHLVPTAIRLVACGDLGWAGEHPHFGSGAPGSSAEVGVSALDGIFRMDLARSIRGRDPAAWRVHLYLDGLF